MVRPEVGFIGLGNMGGNMARHLIEEGYSVTVYDVDPSAVATLTDFGAEKADSPAAVAEVVDIVFTSLPTPDIVRAAYLESDGVLAGAHDDLVAIDMSTVNPGVSETISAEAEKRGASLLDAPVSGGPDNSRDGSLTILVGGDEAVFHADKVQDVLDSLGKKYYHVGDSGAGHTMKLVNNVMSMGNLLLGMEMVSLGAERGIKPQLLMEILRNSGGRSYQFNKRIPRILNRNFEPGFTVDYAKKDLKLAMTMADSMDFPALVGNLVTQLYTKASADGYGDEDIGAVVKLFEQGLIESEEEVDEYFEGLRA